MRLQAVAVLLVSIAVVPVRVHLLQELGRQVRGVEIALGVLDQPPLGERQHGIALFDSEQRSIVNRRRRTVGHDVAVGVDEQLRQHGPYHPLDARFRQLELARRRAGPRPTCCETASSAWS